MFGKLCHKYYSKFWGLYLYFCSKNILPDFHCVSVGKQKMFIGNLIGLLFCWNSEERFVTSSVHHLCVQLCLGVRFPVTLTKIGVLCWWLRGTTGCHQACHQAQTHSHPSKHHWSMCGLCVPIMCRAPSQIPSFAVAAHPIRFVSHESNLWASLMLPGSAGSEGPSHRSRSCWISFPTLHHHDHFPQEPHSTFGGWWLSVLWQSGMWSIFLPRTECPKHQGERERAAPAGGDKDRGTGGRSAVCWTDCGTQWSDWNPYRETRRLCPWFYQISPLLSLLSCWGCTWSSTSETCFRQGCISHHPLQSSLDALGILVSGACSTAQPVEGRGCSLGWRSMSAWGCREGSWIPPGVPAWL